MNDLREMLKHVYQLDDEARADFQHHQARRAKVMKQRHRDDLIYKTHYDEPPQTKQQADDEILLLADEIGAVTGKLERRVRELEAEVAGLKADIKTLLQEKVVQLGKRNVA
jgi:hypothetical protein